jgi:hypothetical protein
MEIKLFPRGTGEDHDDSVLAGIRPEHINVFFSPVQRMQLLFCRAWTNKMVTFIK